MACRSSRATRGSCSIAKDAWSARPGSSCRRPEPAAPRRRRPSRHPRRSSARCSRSASSCAVPTTPCPRSSSTSRSRPACSCSPTSRRRSPTAPATGSRRRRADRHAAVAQEHPQLPSSTQQARFSVYVQADGVTPADSPAPHVADHRRARAPARSSPRSPAPSSTCCRRRTSSASPNGWIPDGGTTTTGNNVDACLDRVGGATRTSATPARSTATAGRSATPTPAARNRDFLGSAAATSTTRRRRRAAIPRPATRRPAPALPQDAFRRGAVTQLFYITNWYHDQLFHLGFDEAAGNFQNDELQRHGRSAAIACWPTRRTAAAPTTPTSPRRRTGSPAACRCIRFTGPTIDRDGDLDAEIVIHELTHGLTQPAGRQRRRPGLERRPAAWAKAGATSTRSSLLNNTNADDPNGQYASGAYATYKLGGGSSTTTSTASAASRTPPTTRSTRSPGRTWTTSPRTIAGGIPTNPLGFETNGALRGPQRRRDLGADAVGGPQPHHRRSGRRQRRRADRQPDDAAARHRRLEDDADQSQLHRRARRRSSTPTARPTPAPTSARSGTASRTAASATTPPRRSARPASPTSGTWALKDVVLRALPGRRRLSPSTTASATTTARIDPGEPIRLTRLADQPAGAAPRSASPAPRRRCRPSTPGVTIPDNTSTYPAIAGGGTAAPSDTFVFTVPPNASCGSVDRLHAARHQLAGHVGADFSLRRRAAASGTGAPVT